MNRLFAVLTLGMFLAAPSGALAFEADWGTKRGDWELNFVGNIENNKIQDEDVTFSNSRIQGTVGYFLTDGLEAGMSLWLLNNSSDFYGEKSTTGTSAPAFFTAYHFDLAGNMTPFVGVMLGFSGSKEEAGGKTNSWNETSFGLMGGAKYFVSEWAAITGQLSLDFRTIKFDGGESYDASRFAIDFGLSLFF